MRLGKGKETILIRFTPERDEWLPPLKASSFLFRRGLCGCYLWVFVCCFCVHQLSLFVCAFRRWVLASHVGGSSKLSGVLWQSLSLSLASKSDNSLRLCGQPRFHNQPESCIFFSLQIKQSVEPIKDLCLSFIFLFHFSRDYYYYISHLTHTPPENQNK